MDFQNKTHSNCKIKENLVTHIDLGIWFLVPVIAQLLSTLI